MSLLYKKLFILLSFVIVSNSALADCQVYIGQMIAELVEIDPALEGELTFIQENVQCLYEEGCNAAYGGGVIFLGTGDNKCHSPAENKEIVYHEFTHAIHSFLGPAILDRSLDEGLADVMTAILTNDPIFADHFFKNRLKNHIRDLRMQLSYPDGWRGDYSGSLIFSSFLWNSFEDLKKITSLNKAKSEIVKVIISLIKHLRIVPFSELNIYLDFKNIFLAALAKADPSLTYKYLFINQMIISGLASIEDQPFGVRDSGELWSIDELEGEWHFEGQSIKTLEDIYEREACYTYYHYLVVFKNKEGLPILVQKVQRMGRHSQKDFVKTEQILSFEEVELVDNSSYSISIPKAEVHIVKRKVELISNFYYPEDIMLTFNDSVFLYKGIEEVQIPAIDIPLSSGQLNINQYGRLIESFFHGVKITNYSLNSSLCL